MEAETRKKAMELVAVEVHAETLRRVLRRNTSAREQNAIRTILEAHEGYTAAREEELVQSEITSLRSRSG